MKPKRTLAKFLKDKERLQEVSTQNNIEQKKRVKILCQISDALSFLHTLVINIRLVSIKQSAGYWVTHL